MPVVYKRTLPYQHFLRFQNKKSDYEHMYHPNKCT